MIKNIVIDCDGCLTDGRKWVDEAGERALIAFHARDNEAARRLIAAGFRVIIVTASDFPGIRRYWNRYNVEVYRMREKLLLADQADPPFLWSETIGVGDDLLDTDFLRACAVSFVTQDAHAELLSEFTPLPVRGGGGVLCAVERKLPAISLYDNDTVTVYQNGGNIHVQKGY